MLILPLAISWFTGVLLAIFDGRQRWVGWLAVASLGTAFATMLNLAWRVLQYGPIQLVTGGWPVGIGIRLRADALGVIFATLAIGLLLVALCYEQLGGIQNRAFPALILFLAVGLIGLFLTGDVFNFYVFFEVSMTAAFALTSYGQERRQIRDALIFTVVNLLGSVLFLISIAALYRVTGTLDMGELAQWVSRVEVRPSIKIAATLFAAFSLKLGLFPFHFWLPPVYRGTLPAIAAMLSGVLANIGSYGLLRFGGNILRRELELGAPLLLLLGAASVIYGALLAVSRGTASQVLAYSSISQAGYFMIAFSIGGPIGYAAAILFSVVNALNKTLLFLSAYVRGWWVGPAFAIGAFSVAGIPPSAGFFGKAALFRVALLEDRAMLVALMFLGGALAVIYMFQIYQRDFWAGDALQTASRPAMQILVFVLATFIMALGIWPEPLLALSQQAANVLAGTYP